MRFYFNQTQWAGEFFYVLALTRKTSKLMGITIWEKFLSGYVITLGMVFALMSINPLGIYSQNMRGERWEKAMGYRCIWERNSHRTVFSNANTNDISCSFCGLRSVPGIKWVSFTNISQDSLDKIYEGHFSFRCFLRNFNYLSFRPIVASVCL